MDRVSSSMKILLLHCDMVQFQAEKKAIQSAEDSDKTKHEIKECLLVLSSVEKRDEENPASIVARYVLEVEKVLTQVKAQRIVLYPYAHLSNTLSNPKIALEILTSAEKILREKIEVVRAPFGWYKSFSFSCKGHPLAELSREFGPEPLITDGCCGNIKETVNPLSPSTIAQSSSRIAPTKPEENQALVNEKKLVSTWYIHDLDGKLHPLTKQDGIVVGYDFKKHVKLGKFVSYEISKVRAVQSEPPHVKYMRKLELVDYEPGSDPGNLRFYPKGRFIKSLIETFVNEQVVEYGGLEIEAPIMYDYEHPALKSYLNRFPARQYTIQTPNKKVFLRFAACFGQFLMAADANFSYKQLPLKLYELTRYSFRVEQHGELTGLRRLRAFTMPDCHCFCENIEAAKNEMKVRFAFSKQLQQKIGFNLEQDLEFAIRVTQEFYEQNKEFVAGLVKNWGKPALIEMWNERFFYFVLKYEWNYVDCLDKASALTTDQIDIENAERYGITYVDTEGKKQFPHILHMSPSGAIERVMYALLERCGEDEKKGKPPMLPIWLSPTHIRLCPVSTEKHLAYSLKLAEEWTAQNIRVDVDDREETIGKKIRGSELEWIPYTVVIGDKEMGNDVPTINVRMRATGKEESMSIPELLGKIHAETKGMPYRPQPLPRLLTKRPIFVGQQ